MSPTQYRKAIERLGVSHSKAAKLLGVSLRTAKGYAAGEHAIPEPTAKLLRLMVRLELTPEEVE